MLLQDSELFLRSLLVEILYSSLLAHAIFEFVCEDVQIGIVRVELLL